MQDETIAGKHPDVIASHDNVLQQPLLELPQGLSIQQAHQAVQTLQQQVFLELRRLQGRDWIFTAILFVTMLCLTSSVSWSELVWPLELASTGCAIRDSQYKQCCAGVKVLARQAAENLYACQQQSAHAAVDSTASATEG